MRATDQSGQGQDHIEVEGFAIIERDTVRRSVPSFDWTRYEQPSARTRLTKPLADSTVALIATPGAYERDQTPFESSARDGDPSHRVIDSDVAEDDLCFCHPGIDLGPAQDDADCVFPVRLLRQMANEGHIGALAPHSIALMGYITQVDVLERVTAPRVIETLVRDEVDLALLVPV